MTKTILVVEDDDNDIFFMEIAMQRAHADVAIQVVTNGEEAIQYLNHTGKFSDQKSYPLPALVLLDLRLPRIPGLDVLQWIRKQKESKKIPVVILSSSNHARDLEKARTLGADSFLVKPANPKELTEMMKCIQRYWIDMKRPPADCKEWKALNLMAN